jgi:hypothetical protein
VTRVWDDVRGEEGGREGQTCCWLRMEGVTVESQPWGGGGNQSEEGGGGVTGWYE